MVVINSINAINISVFDIHTTILPLLLPETEAIQSKFRFLIYPDWYRTKYNEQKKEETKTFQINPLTKDNLQYNHFWKHYQRICRYNNFPDYWMLQLPFILKPIKNFISLDLSKLFNKKVLSEENITLGKIEPKLTIFLSSIGWSTNINIYLKDNFDSQQLINIIHNLRERDVRPFLVDQKNLSLSELYQYCSSLLRQEIYSSENSIPDILTIKRHFVISIEEFEGQVKLYHSFGYHDKNIPKMKNEERAFIHSIIYGRDISIDEFKTQRVSLTPFNDANFAVTEFEHGTLLFMQDLIKKAHLDSHRSNKLVCLNGNIQVCSIILLLWIQFYKKARQRKYLGRKAKALYDNIPSTLNLLPVYYTNKFCQTFYKGHKGLQKIVYRD